MVPSPSPRLWCGFWRDTWEGVLSASGAAMLAEDEARTRRVRSAK